MHFRPPDILKAILALKVIVLAGLLLHYLNVFQFGEMPTHAAEGDGQGESSELANDGYQEPERKPGKKQTFLDKLFNLPEIDKTSIEKSEVGRYMSLLEKKKQEIESRLQVLQEREARMLDIEKSIEEKLRALDQEKSFILDTLQKEKAVSEERLLQLVDFYKKMNAKKAAPVFEQLDKDLVVEMFNRLPEKQIMAIMEAMSPEKSVELTEYYGRVRSGKEYELLKEMNTALMKEFQNCKEAH